MPRTTFIVTEVRCAEGRRDGPGQTAAPRHGSRRQGVPGGAEV